MYFAGLAPYQYSTLVHVVYGALYWYSLTYFDIFSNYKKKWRHYKCDT